MGDPQSAAAGEACRQAFEMAATSRYGEARERLLSLLGEHPDHVDALVLLGKVEYYLGRRASSRRRFETALTYRPDNLPAFFGLQYYRERRRAAWLGGALGAVLLFVVLAAGGVYLALDARLRDRLSDEGARLESALAQRLEELSAAESRRTELLQRIDDRLAGELDLIAAELQRTAGTLAELRSSSGSESAAVSRRLREIGQAQAALRGSIEEFEKELRRLAEAPSAASVPTVPADE